MAITTTEQAQVIIRREAVPATLATGRVRDAVLHLQNNVTLEPGSLPYLAGKEPMNVAMRERMLFEQFTRYDKDNHAHDPSVAGSEEKRRFDMANRLSRVYDIVLNRSLADIEAAVGANPDLRIVAESIISRDPALLAEYNSLMRPNEFIARILKHRKCQTMIADGLKPVFMADRIITDHTAEAELRQTKLEEEHTQLQAKKVKLTAEVKKIDAELVEYTEVLNSGGATKVGKFQDRLATLHAEAEPHQRLVNQYQTQLDQLNRQIEMLQQTKNQILINPGVDSNQVNTTFPKGGGPPITSIHASQPSMSASARMGEIDAQMARFISERDGSSGVVAMLKDAQTKLSKPVQEIKAINDRKVALEAMQQAKNRELADVNASLMPAMESLAKARGEYNNVLRSRNVAEFSIIGELGFAHILPEAMAQALTDMRAEVLKAQETLDTKWVEKQSGEFKDRVFNFLRRPDGKIDWNRFKFQGAGNVWDTFRTHGIDRVIQNEIFAGNATEAQKYKSANAANYSELVQTMQEKIIRYRLIQPRGIVTIRGHQGEALGTAKLSNEEQRDIVGRVGNEFFQKVLAKDPTVVKEIADKHGIQIDPSGNVAEQIRRMPKDTGMAVLVLLMGMGIFGKKE